MKFFRRKQRHDKTEQKNTRTVYLITDADSVILCDDNDDNDEATITFRNDPGIMNTVCRTASMLGISEKHITSERFNEIFGNIML